MNTKSYMHLTASLLLALAACGGGEIETDDPKDKSELTGRKAPARPDPEKPDPEKPDPEKPDPEKPDPEKPDPEKPDPEDKTPKAVALQLIPEAVALKVGDTAQLVMQLRLDDDSTKAATGVTLVSADPAVASVTPAGLITAVGGGQTEVTATVGELSAKASVQVEAPVVEYHIFTDALDNGVQAEALAGGSEPTVSQVQPHQGTAALEVTVGATGAHLRLRRDPVPLAGYNALSFWLRADEATRVDRIGLGRDGDGAGAHQAALTDVDATPTWTRHVLPLPSNTAPAALGSLFFLQTGAAGEGRRLWLDDIRLVHEDGVSLQRASMGDLQRALSIGEQAPLPELSLRASVGATSVTVAVAPGYANYTSSDPAVVQVAGDQLRALTAGGAVITAAFPGLPSDGQLAVTVTAAPTPAVFPTLYNDALGAGITADPTLSASTTNPHGGTHCLQLDVPASGVDAGLSIATPAATTGYNMLSLWVRASKGVSLDAVGVSRGLSQLEVREITVGTDWKNILVPLYNQDTLSNPLFIREGSSDGAYTLWIDDVELINVPASEIFGPIWILRRATISAPRLLTMDDTYGTISRAGSRLQFFVHPSFFTYGALPSGAATFAVSPAGVTITPVRAGLVRANFNGGSVGGQINLTQPAPIDAPTQPPPSPTQPASAVLSVLSSSYSDHAPITWSQDTGVNVTDYTIPGTTVVTKRYEFTPVGFEIQIMFNSATVHQTLDLTNYTTMHIDMWAMHIGELFFGMANGGDGLSVTRTPSSTRRDFTGRNQQWLSVDIPLTAFSNGPRHQISELSIQAFPMGTLDRLFIQNLYFY